MTPDHNPPWSSTYMAPYCYIPPAASVALSMLVSYFYGFLLFYCYILQVDPWAQSSLVLSYYSSPLLHFTATWLPSAVLACFLLLWPYTEPAHQHRLLWSSTSVRWPFTAIYSQPTPEHVSGFLFLFFLCIVSWLLFRCSCFVLFYLFI